jgi:hypothetical protein
MVKFTSRTTVHERNITKIVNNGSAEALHQKAGELPLTQTPLLTVDIIHARHPSK